MSTSTPSPIVAPTHVQDLLRHLHKLSRDQEAGIAPDQEDRFFSSNAADFGRPAFDARLHDKMVALDEDKCHFMYQLALATGATNVVEAGTSHGVSTIYLALAVAQNKARLGTDGTVVATEKDAGKAEVARAYWGQCGKDVVGQIDLRVGDLLETLKTGLPRIDMLLLDIWAPLALPTLKLVQPHFRPGAVVLIDNPILGVKGYTELSEYMQAPGSGFQNLTLPYTSGLGMSVYYPA